MTDGFHISEMSQWIWVPSVAPSITSQEILLVLQEDCSSSRHNIYSFIQQGFPGGSDGRESACNAGDSGSMPESGRSLSEGNGYPLQYSCLENSMDRGAQQATVHGVAKSWK